MARLFERWLSAPAPSDPLYLTNRTFWQKARTWLLVGIPCGAAVTVLVFVGLRAKTTGPSQSLDPSAAEVAAKMLPDLNKVPIPADSEVEIVNAQVTAGERPVLNVSLRNRTDRTLSTVDVVFDVTDKKGSQLGATTVHTANMGPHASVPFTLPLEQQGAAFVLVREVHSR